MNKRQAASQEDDSGPSGEQMLAQALEQIDTTDIDDSSDEDLDADDSDELTGDSDDDGALGDGEDDSDDGDADDPAVARALKSGWRPKEEYTGPPGKWKDYDEFNAVGDKIAGRLNSKIDDLSAQNQTQHEMIKKLVRAQGEIAKQTREATIKELKAQRREAIEERDVDTVEALDQEIDKVSSAEPDLEFEDEPQKQEIDSEVAAFIDEEKHWFNSSNPKMCEYAIGIESLERKTEPDASSELIMRRVKAAVVKKFPDKFARRKRAHAPVEAGSTPKGGKGRKNSFADYPEEVRQLARQFEKSGVMSQAEYLKLLKEGGK